MNNYILNDKHPIFFNVINEKININYHKKNELMNIKCKIDKISSKSWEKSKKKLNIYEYIYTSSRKNRNICNILPVSRSYFKIYEILKKIIKIENEGIAGCIAEGPGGFIHCINDNTNMNVYAITLISNINKNIPFWNQQIINNDKNKLCYGKDGTGDIYNLDNVYDYIDSFEGNLCHLVTGDGGFDYSMDYNSQESKSYKLLYCEIFIALNIQKKSGSLIIKFFDLFNYNTIQLLYILYICYSEINIFKPNTSRLSNSEKYIVCNNFKGCNTEIIKIMEKHYHNLNLNIKVPYSFIKEIFNYNDNFVTLQIKTINSIIENINEENENKPTKQQIEVALSWCKKYNLPINDECIYKV